VIGPNANDTGVMQGNYYGQAPFVITPLMGLSTIAGVETYYAHGCDIDSNDTSGFAEAQQVAAESDVVILVLGINNDIEAEGQDRYEISLPGMQWALLSAVEQSAKGPVILVFLQGGPIDITQARDDPNVAAILWAGYPGQAGGTAIADVLFGNYNPAGRLPYTVYPADYVNQVAMTDMQMRPSTNPPNPGRTYKFYTGTAVYNFGDGMSYTSFNYVWNPPSPTGKPATTVLSTSDLLQAHIANQDVNSYSVTVTNNGTVAGDDVVLCFMTFPGAPQPDYPLSQLIGFKRITLAPGASDYVFFGIRAASLAHVDQSGEKWIHPGTYALVLGSKFDGHGNVEHHIQVTGNAVQLTKWQSWA